MANPAATTPLAALQERFAIIDLSGEIRIVDLIQIQDVLSGATNRNPAFYKKAEGEVVMKRALEELPVPSKPSEVIRDFWTSPGTVMYTGTAFTPEKTAADILNFWVGPVPEAHPGNWVKLRDFIRDVICAGDSESYEYVIRFMAHAVQKPEEKPGVLLALLGGQGTGKGMYFAIWRAIWGRTTLLVSNVDRVLGQFNASLERNFVICMDEALFAGDKRSVDRLKSLVTEPYIQVEQKYQPDRTIASVHRFMASSNHEHFAHVEQDDRRFVFLRVSELKKQDTVYFSGIHAAINDPATIGAMVYYLQRKDLTGFDVRKKPNTTEHHSQKMKSLQGVERYWYEVLASGDLDGGSGSSVHMAGDSEWTQSVFVPTAELVSRYKNFNKNAQRHQTVQSAEVSESIRRLCSSARVGRQICKRGHIATPSQQRGLILPDLATARADFERVMRSKVQWD